MFSKSDAAREHDDFVEAVFFVAFKVLKGEQAPVDERLTEFISKIGGAI
jgi:hypothetical protein